MEGVVVGDVGEGSDEKWSQHVLPAEHVLNSNPLHCVLLQLVEGIHQLPGAVGSDILALVLDDPKSAVQQVLGVPRHHEAMVDLIHFTKQNPAEKPQFFSPEPFDNPKGREHEPHSMIEHDSLVSVLLGGAVRMEGVPDSLIFSHW